MVKSVQKTALYEFGPFRVDPVKRLLLRDREPIQLAPKALDTLLVLIENSGRVVEKTELIDRVWPDSFVEEINLTVYISALRKALGESPDEHRYIVTVPRRGYSFVAKVREILAEEDTLSENAETSSVAPGIEVESAPLEAVECAHPPTALSSPKSKRSLRIWSACLAIAVITTLGGGLLISNRLRQQPNSMIGKSIAVFPFKVIGSQDEEYLELGMADALITRLSKLDQVSVRPTSAIFNYLGKTYDPQTAGSELGVDAVMQGTIQQVGERVRVTVQLIRVADGSSIWADRFDERRINIFAVQDSISEQVAQALSLKLSSSDKEMLAKRHTQNTDAYHAYLKGMYFWSKRREDNLKRSIEYFQQAIDTDPNYAMAYAGLGDAAALLAIDSAESSARRQYWEKAKAAAAKAIEIDEGIAEAHIAMALVKMNYEMNSAAAGREQIRAVELDPNNATAHQRLGWYLLASGQFDRAAQEMKLAVELDPLSVINHAARSNLLYYLGQYDEAIEESRKALELDPSLDVANHCLGLAYEQKGEYDRAIAEIERAGKNNKDDVQILEALGHVYGVSGRVADARRIIQELKSLLAKNSSAIYSIALVYAGLGDKDRAFEWLGKGARAKAQTALRFRIDPRLANIRDDSRFYSLLEMRARQ